MNTCTTLVQHLTTPLAGEVVTVTRGVVYTGRLVRVIETERGIHVQTVAASGTLCGQYIKADTVLHYTVG